ncbi:hypothetical protein [Brevibacillus brevis]|uniref:hypothetical protein n=1 Tax=Brevibacillus brevis TaxID=1393 RepID=UPI000D0F1742|nr:hypothetical protein [Brevibacillus brevis]PSJ68205.1 hypothetical protein C7J99_17555 [Brevibacillus brevis]RED35704.1 hypothetical protein DES34_101363 [Brevibacillus brevis]GEC89247.1 hypothetical protein BBR01nite_15780 [Brevibacillus brevis]VEF89185.1 Uncharacterised protein [Brevibacillus brevis]
MGNNEAKKTMRFWIFAGIAAIASSQLPLLLKKQQQEENQTKEPKKKKSKWMKFLIGAVLFVVILWLFDYFI